MIDNADGSYLAQITALSSPLGRWTLRSCTQNCPASACQVLNLLWALLAAESFEAAHK
jgi:hypothetical protein